MVNDMMDAGLGDAMSQPGLPPADMRRLTVAQFRVFGVTKVAYVTVSQDADDTPAYTMRGADGVVVANFDDVDLVFEIANHLGLAVVPVH